MQYIMETRVYSSMNLSKEVEMTLVRGGGNYGFDINKCKETIRDTRKLY